ncbi:hypothetical protein RV00_GL001763 [Enterococcus devriesei]|uniref:Uncharacterized protein n=1 Tax=Enterococcus devriesei TaxID=319970 RepID=A0A1L8SX29_9ENTE|nr:hypothetical protein RV00_GL001763 [Enterococcus devriesei]
MFAAAMKLFLRFKGQFSFTQLFQVGLKLSTLEKLISPYTKGIK